MQSLFNKREIALKSFDKSYFYINEHSDEEINLNPYPPVSFQ